MFYKVYACLDLKSLIRALKSYVELQNTFLVKDLANICKNEQYLLAYGEWVVRVEVAAKTSAARGSLVQCIILKTISRRRSPSSVPTSPNPFALRS